MDTRMHRYLGLCGLALLALQLGAQEAPRMPTQKTGRAQTPVRSDAMALQMTPAKQQVYVGEPLRIDLTWSAAIEATRLKALHLYPQFFDYPYVDVVLPRNTAPEAAQVGLPIGGRRVIATREVKEGQAQQLGQITLPIYLRFDKPGLHTLPETYLECALLDRPASDFARYAAYFNNSLFEATERGEAYRPIFVTAPEQRIEVLPLPPSERGALFSELFTPTDFEVNIQQSEVNIGELIELHLLVRSEAPHGLIDLPDLSRQPGLQRRFLVDPNYGHLWHPEGSEFRIRLRPLTTAITAFPALRIQVFNPQTARYEIRSSGPIPLEVRPVDGADYIELADIEGARVPLTEQPDGIWHNLPKQAMNDLLNELHRLANTHFWWLLAAAPILFCLLRPLVLHLRRRATDTRYRRSARAYAEFKRTRGHSDEKWQAFLRFLAATFESNEKAWSRQDSESALRDSGLNETAIREIVALHDAADAQDYGSRESAPAFHKLDALARCIRRLTLSLILFCALSGLALPRPAMADNWAEAQTHWAEAQAAPVGSEAAFDLYQQAALKFQAAAVEHSGEAWQNAGNAWFQASAIGRAIAAYREAARYRPFDPRLQDSLSAARALVINDVPTPRPQSWWRQVPAMWLHSTLVCLNFLFWMLLLADLRYRRRAWFRTATLCAACLFIVSVLALLKSHGHERMGVIVVDEATGKKGPGYAYADAFNEPLFDGLEFRLKEQRNAWARIELTDGRECWVSISQTSVGGSHL